MKILIEGMDYVGKDAVADEIISAVPNCKKRNSVIASCNPHYPEAAKLSKMGESQSLIAAALLSSVRFDFDKCINGECCGLNNSDHLLQVSLTAFRSFAYHNESNPEIAEMFLGCLMLHSKFLKEFDKVILLDASLTERRSRLNAKKRIATDHDKKLLSDSKMVEATDRSIRFVLDRFVGERRFLKIDTTKMTIPQVANVVKYYCGLNR